MAIISLKKIEHYTHINRTQLSIDDRQGFINAHAIIHNHLSAPQLKNVSNAGFVQAKIINEMIGKIYKPKNICLQF